MIGAGQTISPGNSPGTADTGSQIWAGGGTYLWEINDATGTAGFDPGWDRLLGTDTLAITATDSSQFTILVTSLTLGNESGWAANFNQYDSYAWLIADFEEDVVGFDAAAFQIDRDGFLNTATGTFGIALGGSGGVGGDDSQIYLTYTAVPEPGSFALVGFASAVALGGVIAKRNRRSRKVAAAYGAVWACQGPRRSRGIWGHSGR